MDSCPKCGSTELLGLFAAFWVKLDSAGEPIGQWRDWQSETEITEKRTCLRCDHEFEIGGADEK